MLYSFIVGVDLGQASDPTAICILEEASWVPAGLAIRSPGQNQTGGLVEAEAAGWQWPAETPPATIERARKSIPASRPGKPPLRIPHLERIPLGTSYQAVARYVQQLLASPPLSEVSTALLIDYGGVGRAVYDHYIDIGLRPYGISVTSGEQVHQDDVGWRTPKRELVAHAQMILSSGRLKIVTPSRDAEALRQELKNYRVKVSKAGNDLYEPYRSSQHDDLVMAFAMCSWFREWINLYYDRAQAAAAVR